MSLFLSVQELYISCAEYIDRKGGIFMTRKMKYSEYGGFLFTVAAGTLFHFLYEWCNENDLIALFTPVNESTWEHLKLLFFPVLFYSIPQYFLTGKEYRNFITAKLTGAVVGMITITAFFYTYTGIIGQNYLFMDIVTFILGAAACYLLSGYLIAKQPDFRFPCVINLLILALILFLFFFYTFAPPQIPLFISPV